ncbi:MAG: hypothetical protein H0X41_07105 [Chitinophagaceae bacterium]|nr:hypothetical protein [Chitinophagaceae bacterium]
MKLTDNGSHVVCFGESLWVVSAQGAEAGGSPVNLARNLKQLGMSPALITRVGIDEEGKRLIRLIENDTIVTDYFQIDYDVPTGVAHSPAGLQHHGKPEAWDNINWDNSFEKLATDCRFFVHGSLPARSKISRDTLYTFMEMASRRVFDMNLHTPFYTKKIIEDCLRGAHILKLNIAELELITGWFVYNDSIEDRMQVLQNRFGIPYIIVSKDGKGCMLNAEGSVFGHDGFGEGHGNTFGSGDAFLAGFLQQFSHNSPPEKIIEYACALQSLVASAQGGCPAYEISQIHQIINK